MGRQLLAEIRPLGYTRSVTHLQRLLNSWRKRILLRCSQQLHRTPQLCLVAPRRILYRRSSRRRYV